MSTDQIGLSKAKRLPTNPTLPELLQRELSEPLPKMFAPPKLASCLPSRNRMCDLSNTALPKRFTIIESHIKTHNKFVVVPINLLKLPKYVFPLRVKSKSAQTRLRLSSEKSGRQAESHFSAQISCTWSPQSATFDCQPLQPHSQTAPTFTTTNLT